MLTTALQQSIKIDVTEYLGVKEYAYTCYGDSDSKDIFYVVPEIPVFAKRDTNTPSFMFYKYRSEDTQGGYAHHRAAAAAECGNERPHPPAAV